MKNNLAETLKEMRIKAGYSQKEVYEMFHIRQSTFSAWETGRAEPSADMLLKLCRLYKVNDLFAAFGYDAYKKDENLQLTVNETAMIEKYRELDCHGREMVDFTLRKEWERAAAKPESKVISLAADKKEAPDYLIPQAAHNEYAADPEEQEKMREDLSHLKIPEGNA